MLVRRPSQVFQACANPSDTSTSAFCPSHSDTVTAVVTAVRAYSGVLWVNVEAGLRALDMLLKPSPARPMDSHEACQQLVACGGVPVLVDQLRSQRALSDSSIAQLAACALASALSCGGHASVEARHAARGTGAEAALSRLLAAHGSGADVDLLGALSAASAALSLAQGAATTV